MSKNLNITMFFDDPLKEVGIREFARLSKVSPATASTFLATQVKDGLLTRRHDRRVILFKADESSKRYKDAKRCYTIQNIRYSGLLEFLDAELRFPLAIFLFGSFAKAENRPGSDIDLFVVARTKKDLDFSRFERVLKAPLQVFVHTVEEINELKKKNPHLLNNVLNGVRLSGFWEVIHV